MADDNGIKNVSITTATLILAVFTLLSRLIGAARDIIFASTFGAGTFLDTYSAAFRIPDFITNFFILGTLSVSFLPVFNKLLVRNEQRARELSNTIFSISLAGVTALCFIMFLFTPLVINLIAPGFEGEQRELTILFTRILLISPIIFTASSLASIILQSYHKFVPTALAPIFYNLGIILGALVFYKWIGPVGLMLGVLLGALAHLAINFTPVFKLPVRPKISFNFGLPELKEVWRLYKPRMLALDNLQVSLLVGTIIGSTLAAGSISVFNLAENLQAAPLGIFALSFAVAAFPQLSKTWATGNIEDFKNTLVKTSIQILFFIIPISAMVFLMRAQVVRLLYGHGQFDWQDTILTAQTLGVLALSAFAQGLSPLLARAFYAAHNTFIPVVVSIITMVTNVVLAVVFSRMWGVIGLGAAASVASVVSFSLLFFLLQKRLGAVRSAPATESVLKILIASSFAATFTYGALYAIAPVVDTSTGLGILIQLVVASSVGVSIYLVTGLLLNLREARALAQTVRLAVLRIARPLASFVNLSDDAKN